MKFVLVAIFSYLLGSIPFSYIIAKTFFKKDIFELDLPDDYGVLITNPPYGVRIKDQVSDLQKELGKIYKSLKTWSFYIITSDENFEKDFNKKADRNRKLYNGGIKTYYYQYYGPRPKK